MPLNVTAAVPTTTTNIVQAAKSATAAAASTAASSGGVLTKYMPLFVIIFIAGLVFTILRSSGGDKNAKSFSSLLKMPADAIGIIADLGTNEIKIVAMKRVGGIYMYTDRTNTWKTFIPVNNHYYKFLGKPALLGMEYDRTSVEVEPDALASFGIAAAANNEIAAIYDSEFDKSKTLLQLLNAAAKMTGKVTGKLKAIDGVALEISPPKLIRSTIRYISNTNRAAVNAQHNMWMHIEGTSKAMQKRMGWLSDPNAGRNMFWMAVALIVVVVAYYLSRVFSGLGGH